MKRRIVLLLSAGGAAFALHAAWLLWSGERIARQWVEVDGESALGHYLSQHDYLLSLSYGVVAGFTVYVVLRARADAKSGATGIFQGITLAGLLYWGGCWLVGCCGSPLLPVYLNIFGASFLGFTKPLVLGLTLSSVAVSWWWMNRRARRGCGCTDAGCTTPMKGEQATQVIRSELAEGMKLPKCQQCGCMKETLEQLSGFLSARTSESAKSLAAKITEWQRQMKPIKYSCLGCAHCYPAVATNSLHQGYPESAEVTSRSCEFEERVGIWPPVPGEYVSFCEGESCPVAVSTLASPDLTEALARRRPRELCIVGKTETENIGIDKLVKNSITNRTIRFLLLAGREPQGHETGKTLLALSASGVDDSMRIIGSPARRPILRNVTRQEVEAFRQQVQVVDMVGCEDVEQIVNRISQLSAAPRPLGGSCDVCEPPPAANLPAPVVEARPPARVELDKAGYFVILPNAAQRLIVVEHYSYDNRLLQVIKGDDARSLYTTILDNGWVTLLSHAAYLGKELTRAELSLTNGSGYVQDGA